VLETGIAPTAFFTASAVIAEVGELIQFTNMSEGTDLTFEWDFDDGSPIVSEPDPSHAFDAPGIYQVTLTASNELGSDSYTLEIEVVEPPEPLNIFYYPLIFKQEN
jgi:PKD repeat protein